MLALIILLLGIVTEASSIPFDTNNTAEYDYVILGGGTCGLVIAARLSENPNVRVAVIEAGDSVQFNPNVTNTTSYGLSLGTSIDWAYTSLPQQYANNKSVTYHSGKSLGGTSTINGMTYMRAQKAQVDAWELMGNPGWNWESLLPHYKGSEMFEPPTIEQQVLGAGCDLSAHGDNGPVTVSFNPSLLDGDTHSLLNKTWSALRVPWNADTNTGDVRGFNIWPQTLDGKANVREDAARAYYYPIQDRSNLHVYLNSRADRIIWSDTSACDDVKATGVNLVSAIGEAKVVHANREVILSTGSLQTPLLLERSGIGNPSILQQFSIDTMVNLPNVGENLQDQVNTAISASASGNFSGYPTFAASVNVDDLFGPTKDDVAQRILSQLPSYAAEISQASYGAVDPDVQEMLLRTQVDLIFNRSTPVAEILSAFASGPSGSVAVLPFWGLLPFARGSVHMSGKKINDPPAINPNFFMLEWDRQLQVATAKLARKLLTTAPLSSIVRAELAPGTEVPFDASDSVWLAWLKNNYSPNHHPIGTAAMLPKNLGGVVSPELKVYGTSNVRIMDASVIPFQVCGHLTSTLYAMAERAADIIKTAA